MSTAELDHLLYLNWRELKQGAPSASLLMSNFLGFRDAARLIGGGDVVEFVDAERGLWSSNLRPTGGVTPAPSEPSTVTPEAPLAPDQSIPSIDGGADQGLIDVNPVDPKLAS